MCHDWDPRWRKGSVLKWFADDFMEKKIGNYREVRCRNFLGGEKVDG